MARLKDHYDQIVRAKLVEQFGYQNGLQVPRLEKIVLNMAVGKAVSDKKKLEAAAVELAKISGQKPVLCKARKSVANFKLPSHSSATENSTLFRRMQTAGV